MRFQPQNKNDKKTIQYTQGWGKNARKASEKIVAIVKQACNIHAVTYKLDPACLFQLV